MSDAVITALITTAGSITVAFLTVFYGSKRHDHDDEEDLRREIEDLKKQNDELRKQEEKSEQ